MYVINYALSIVNTEFEGGVHHGCEGDEEADAAGEEGIGLEAEQDEDKAVNH